MDMLTHTNVIKLNDEELLKVVGGVSLTGSLLKNLGGLFDTVYRIGNLFGSSLRRIFTKSICLIK